MPTDTHAKTPAALDPLTLPEINRTGYPAPFAADVAGRFYRRLGPLLGLTQFGVSIARLEPGAWSSQRHWHENEDEFLYVMEGRPTLVTDQGEQELQPGMVAGFPAGAPNGHHLINKSDRPALVLVVGTKAAADCAHYSDVDLLYRREADGKEGFFKKSGEKY
ncbi:MAG TPA: cupin domain-containing protein [Polyangia bacterium]|nr:cupin domain-containing protein [Polyangia bacterium]